VTKVSINFVLAAAAFAEKDEYDTLFISNYVDRFVRDEIKRVPVSATCSCSASGATRCGCGWIPTSGRANITADEVLQALREQNVQVAAGRWGPRRPRGTDVSAQRALGGRLTEPAEFRADHPEACRRGHARPLADVGRRRARARATPLWRGTRDATPSLRRAAVEIGVCSLPPRTRLARCMD